MKMMNTRGTTVPQMTPSAEISSVKQTYGKSTTSQLLTCGSPNRCLTPPRDASAGESGVWPVHN